MKPLNEQLWQSTAEDVLSVLLTEQYVTEGENYFNRAFYEMGMCFYHMPLGKWRILFNAIHEIHQEKRAVTWQAIAEKCGETVTQQWHAELCTLCDETRMGRVFKENVERLIEYGETQSIITALQESIDCLKSGGDRDKEIDTLMSSLAVSSAEQIRDTSAAGAASRLEAYLNEAPHTVVSTGIDWLDAATNGPLPSQLWYLAGPYKSSKTRIAYNIAVKAAEQGHETAILSRENQEPVIAAQIVCMYAIQWLLERVDYDPEQPVWWISPTKLLLAKNAYKEWYPKVKADAVSAGIKAFTALKDRLHILDSTPDGGRLSDITSIRKGVRRLKRLHGTKLFLIDHLGLVKREGTVYEKTSANSNDFQELSREDGKNPITLMVLAQLNEETIKNGDSYSAGVKGGGDPAADADVLLTTTPVKLGDGEYYNDRTMLRVKYNRWGPAGDKHEVIFHPESGFILPSKTINLTELTA